MTGSGFTGPVGPTHLENLATNNCCVSSNPEACSVGVDFGLPPLAGSTPTLG